MSDFNNVDLSGRLTKNPFIGENKTSFTIAVNRNNEDFPNIVTFKEVAKNFAKILSKGRRVGVVDTLRTRSYMNDENKKV